MWKSIVVGFSFAAVVSCLLSMFFGYSFRFSLGVGGVTCFVLASVLVTVAVDDKRSRRG